MVPLCTIEDVLEHIKCVYQNDVTTTFVLVWANRNDPQSATMLLRNMEYYHLRSDKYIDFFFPGYIEQNSYTINSFNWEFNVSDFVESIKRIENISKWKYSGSTEFLFLEYKNRKIDFKHTISINIDQFLNDNPRLSLSNLVEDIIRVARSCNKVPEFSRQLNLMEAQRNCKNSIKQWIIKQFGGIFFGTFRLKNLKNNKK